MLNHKINTGINMISLENTSTTLAFTTSFVVPKVKIAKRTHFSGFLAQNGGCKN